MKKSILALAMLASTLLCLPQALLAKQPQDIPTITIAADKVKAKMSPMLYGLMTEEINFSYEGGLYGELIRNRSFKGEAGFAYFNEEPVYWTALGSAEIALDKNQPLNQALNLSLMLNVKDASEAHPAGISNPGYWGIPIKPNTTFKASFYAKAEGKTGPITVAIASKSGTIMTSAKVSGLSGEWKKYEVTLTTTKDIKPSKDNIFTLTTTTPAKIWLQQVSLFGDTFNNRDGGNRRDLMEMMAGLKPTFLRFPGGNYVEGDYFTQRFEWKKTIGIVESRPGHRSPWNYWSTDGMGLMEFLLWCEELKVEPVLGVFAGYALQGEHVSSPEELAPYVQEALDEIEYITGDVTTTWGAKRAADGHPEPFKLTYVEIGNEDFFDRSGSYDKRFAIFYKAIKAKYPHLQLISSASAEATPSQRPDIIDEHTYGWGEANMYEHMNDYDNRSRNDPKIFVGEWATHDGWPMPNMRAAIADAAYLTSLERNSDHVIMSAYAPMLANVSHIGGHSRDNSMHWAINLIGYDAIDAFATPSYHVLKLFAETKGDVVLESQGNHIPQWSLNNKSLPSLYWVVTRSEKEKKIYIKLVNRGTKKQPIKLKLSGVKSVSSRGLMTVISSDDPEAGNSIEKPNQITPKTETITGVSKDFTVTVPAYSVSVLVLSTQ